MATKRPVLEAWNRFKTNHPVISGQLEERFGRNHPVMAAVVAGLQGAADDDSSPVTEADVPRLVSAISAAIESSGPAVSQLDAERWWQNRILVGGIIYAVGLIFPDIQLNADQVVAAGPVFEAAGVALAGAGTLLTKWLAPIDWKRPWTIFGIGRGRPRSA